MSIPTLVPLAANILRCATNIEKHLHQNGLPSPSLKPGGPSKLLLHPELEADLVQALEALDELNTLLLGPVGWLVSQMHSAIGMVSLHAMYRYKIPALFAVGDEISVDELAQRSGADCDVVGRLVQHAVTNRLLTRPRPGFVAHSAASEAMALSPGLMAWIGSFSEDIWPASPRVLDATLQPCQTGHNLAEGTSTTFFDTLANDPARAQRFASAMSVMQQSPGWTPAAALDAFDWAALGHNQTATIVDIGGSDGAFMTALLGRHPLLNAVVQDLPLVIQTAVHLKRPPGIILQAHDFFTPQTVHGADAYVLRMILHNWSDDKAVRILQQLVPALKPGARVIINDHCLWPTPRLLEERQARCADLIMMAIFNGKERSEDEWRGLLARADPRFRLRSVVRLSSGPLAMMEVVWDR